MAVKCLLLHGHIAAATLQPRRLSPQMVRCRPSAHRRVPHDLPHAADVLPCSCEVAVRLERRLEPLAHKLEGGVFHRETRGCTD
jgi:hypothetical protein